ncbi:GAF domain-containing sensor histidine kinase [Leptothermofonsia sp. ETS-13]|uniref:GAF domain-containing sensor histidine kinase n=1 Tax=Leptothermofonsia sp. ETS-13 TaxID=3035696 RepID=UPI003B9F2992
MNVTTRERQRLLVMEELGILDSESIPVFEEATQTAAHFLDTPICILGLMEQDRQRFKSAVGLSRLGLMNKLATSRQFPRSESFCAYVVDSHQALAIENTLTHPAFASSSLTHQYGIRSYLGVPLMTSNGFCVGTLAVMDVITRRFTERDVQFLELTARWSMSEFERNQAGVAKPIPSLEPPFDLNSVDFNPSEQPVIADQVKIQLLSHLTQELRTPLTSVMGMASVLTREIYGPLTAKQKEYLDIIHNSGQYLLSLVNEIIELSSPKDSPRGLNLASVDIEMLCQQAINTLEHAAQRREQEIRLSVEPGRRIWLLDKDKIRQILYHLIFDVIQSSNAGSIVRLHVSHRGRNLNIAVWVSHPWLGEGLPYAEVCAQPSLVITNVNSTDVDPYSGFSLSELDSDLVSDGLGLTAVVEEDPAEKWRSGELEGDRENSPHSKLGLLLSQQLAEMHGGQIKIQGTPESGYRYMINLPQLAEPGENL